MTHVAVLVPGIMGSVLRLGGELIWPGPFRSLLLTYGNMPALLRDDLVATDVIRRFSISEQYGALIADLNLCGFTEREDPPIVFAFAYDWRKSVSIAAQGLADMLDDAVGAHRGEVEVSLVGHSMGGLVCRYYLESGDFSTRPAFTSVRQLLALGNPPPRSAAGPHGRAARKWWRRRRGGPYRAHARSPVGVCVFIELA